MGKNGDFANLHNWAYFKNNAENTAKGGMDLDWGELFASMMKNEECHPEPAKDLYLQVK